MTQRSDSHKNHYKPSLPKTEKLKLKRGGRKIKAEVKAHLCLALSVSVLFFTLNRIKPFSRYSEQRRQKNNGKNFGGFFFSESCDNMSLLKMWLFPADARTGASRL